MIHYCLDPHTMTLLVSVFCMISSLLAAGIAYMRGSLSLTASLGAFGLAAALYFTGGLLFLVLLLVFFASSTILTRFKASGKAPLEAPVHARSGKKRDLIQVAANGGAALIMAVLLFLSKNQLFSIAVAAAFASCNADTWASEIGILSKRPPVSLVTLRPVRRGLSGGVSLLGIAASLGGAAAIALTYALYQMVSGGEPVRIMQHFAAILLAGFAGSILDSLLGATLQAKYINSQTKELTEKPGCGEKANLLYSGIRFVNNDFVNFASSLIAAALVLILLRE